MSTLFDALNPTDDDAVSVASTAVKIKNPVKKAWCQAQWTNLSYQAEKLALADVYFDKETMLLDKLTNKKLWQLVVGHADLLENFAYRSSNTHFACRIVCSICSARRRPRLRIQ